MAFAILAIWWAVTRKQGRVVLLAPTHRQINNIIWKEIKELLRRAKYPLGGVMHANPDRGIEWPDGSQIFGFSTDGIEKVAGLSGNILYLCDEASGIPDAIHEVISTNPGGKLAMISNPTRSLGAFYNAFHSRRASWFTLVISSIEAAENNPKLPNGKYKYPYLANAEWIEARRLEYGEDSPYFDVRIRGRFARQSDNSVISLAMAQEAVERWRAPDRSDGRLVIGVDVARFGSDHSAIVWRRGRYVGGIELYQGADNVALAGHVRDLCSRECIRGEVAQVRVDTSNGGGCADILRHSGAANIEVRDVQAQESSTRAEYVRKRDELWFSLRDWLRTGAIPDDSRMVADLTAPSFDYDEKGRAKVQSKRELRKSISRSTDRADALALCCWEDNQAVWDPVIG